MYEERIGKLKMRDCENVSFYDLQDEEVLCYCDVCGREVYIGEVIWHDEEATVVVHDDCLLDYAKSILYERNADEFLVGGTEE